MSEQEKETKNPDEIVDIVGMILEFNGKQQGQWLKILTPNQMLRRLPISLAQPKALYFLYRYKELTKNIYKSLIDSI